MRIPRCFLILSLCLFASCSRLDQRPLFSVALPPFGTASVTGTAATLRKLSTDSTTFTVTLDKPAERNGLVHLVHSGTAVYNTDYSVTGLDTNGDAQFAAGDLTQTFVIKTLDTFQPEDRTIQIDIGASGDVTPDLVSPGTFTSSVRGIYDFNFGALFNDGQPFSSMPTPYSLISFSRSSVGTYYDADGILKTAASGIPRFNHNPLTGQPLGLMLEATASNLVTQSESFDLNWTPTGLSAFGSGSVVDSPATRAPDNSLNAEFIAEDSSTASAHSLTRVVTMTANYTHEFSVFVKAAGRDTVALTAAQDTAPANYVQAIFKLDGSSPVTSSAGSSSLPTPPTSVEQLPNGWYRLSLRGRPSTTGNTRLVISLVNSSSAMTYNGDPTKGVYVWGANDAANNTVLTHSSYIPNPDVTAVTRSAESATASGTAAFYNGLAGSLLTEFTLEAYVTVGNSVPQTLFSLGTSSTDYLSIRARQSGTTATTVMSGKVASAGNTTGNSTVSTTAVSQTMVPHVLSVGFTSTGWSSSIDAAATVTGGFTSMPAITGIMFGGQPGVSGYNLKGDLYRAMLIKDQRADSDLRAWTTAPFAFRQFTPTVQLAQSQLSTTERSGPQSFIVGLNERSAQPITVEYSLAGATSRFAPTAVSGVLTFAPGELRKVVTVVPVQDGVTQGASSLTMTLARPSGATLGTRNTNALSITD